VQEVKFAVRSEIIQNKLREQNAEFLNVQPGGTKNDWALKAE